VTGWGVVELDGGVFELSLFVEEPEARIATMRPINAAVLSANSQRMISLRCRGLDEERSGAVMGLEPTSWSRDESAE